jgi:hypothetical protein
VNISRDALTAAARGELRPGINPRIAVLIAYSGLAGNRLDPGTFDDAAILLRAETLLLEDLSIADALADALAEHATLNVESWRR